MSEELLKVVPYASMRFYELMAERFGEQGKNAWFVGFHIYAFRKGIRCAQRAVSKGQPLDYASYQLYRETIFQTPEARNAEKPKSISKKEFKEGELVSCNYGCQTKDCFREFNAPAELEEIWCKNVDRMMMYSYNPEIGVGYEVTETFLTADHCEHHCKWSGICENMTMPKRTEDAPPLSYLTWSSYASMADNAVAIFGDAGKEIAEQVRQDIIDKFGMDTWMSMEQFKGMDLDSFFRV